jgi:hypothetical protein
VMGATLPPVTAFIGVLLAQRLNDRDEFFPTSHVRLEFPVDSSRSLREWALPTRDIVLSDLADRFNSVKPKHL